MSPPTFQLSASMMLPRLPRARLLVCLVLAGAAGETSKSTVCGDMSAVFLYSPDSVSVDAASASTMSFWPSPDTPA
jgi:hypothetical protein